MVQVFVGLAMEIKYAEEINIRRYQSVNWFINIALNNLELEFFLLNKKIIKVFFKEKMNIYNK